ncbi:hypothetical protein [Mycolicibacterium sp. P1-18]|uniref:hypothetical protein n=1 Tax=Mycolicibacterium sp. P1-18 TaxID=2024615 RepID=UPI00156708F4|nr:hypothetical protein [Mycolicibacterium sp. P1-18]
MAKKFTVALSSGQTATYEGNFRVSNYGLLIVNPSAGSSKQLLYPAHAWTALDVKN